MKTIETAEQIGLFGAAATAFRAIATAKPADAHALSAAGLVVVALARAGVSSSPTGPRPAYRRSIAPSTKPCSTPRGASPPAS